MHTHLTRLIAAYTGRDASDTETILHTHALLGEILAFRLGGKPSCYAPAGHNLMRIKPRRLVR
jgi:hypothetical protein